MSPRYNTITQNPGKKIAAVNEDLVDLTDNLKAALDNDPTNASVSEGSGYLDLAKELKQIKDSLSISNNTINNFNSELESLKENVPVNLNPVIFNPVWSETPTPNYELPTINNGSYPLFGLDHNNNDALTVIYTYGLSEDWQTDFTNGTIQKQLVSNLSNSLKYMGSGSINENSLVTTKVYTIDDGFNFSCKVTLADGNGNDQVLGYNASDGVSGIVGMSTINAVGTSEMEIVLVKDQGSSVIRVWKNSTEIVDATFTFSPGRLVVIANRNATFSEVKLTYTTVDLGISSMLKEYTHVRVATIQSANPITQQNVDDYDKANVIIQNESTRFDPTKDYSGVGYVLKVGAAQYYQIGKADNFLLEAEYVKRLGNIIIGADLILGGSGNGATYTAATSNLENPKDKSVTLSLKYYSKDVAYLRERVTVVGTGAPTVGFSDLTPATQAILLAGYKDSLPDGSPVPTDAELTAAFTQSFSGYSLLQTVLAVSFASRPLQSAPEFINSADLEILTATSIDNIPFTVQNIESYSQLSDKFKPEVVYKIDGSNYTSTGNFSVESTEAVKNFNIKDFKLFAPYVYADLIPQQLNVTSITFNTLDKTALTDVINDSNSFPSKADLVEKGLGSIADAYINAINQFFPGEGETRFDNLSYSTYLNLMVLNYPSTGNTYTINDLNGDYTLDVTSLAAGDEQKFRQALAMKENADVKDALNIPETGVFGYSVMGLLPTGTVPVLWYFISPTRSPDNVWLYTRVFDLKTMSYVDADVRREGDVTIITNLTTVPNAVKDKYTSAHSIDLDASGVVNSTDKILWNYTGEGGQIYYNYTDVSDPDNQINKVTISSDGGSTWFTDVEAFTGGWILAGQTPPDASKLNSVYVKTWDEVEARLVELATSVAQQ